MLITDLYMPPKVAAHCYDVFDLRGKAIGFGQAITCPFCEAEHLHGEVYGHRTSHCIATPFGKRGKGIDYRDLRHNPGYELCNPAAAVDWDMERLRGALIVMRNKYYRLRSESRINSEYASARDKKLAGIAEDQAAEIKALLKSAGVEL